MTNKISSALIVAIVVLIVVIFVVFILLQHYINKNNYYRKIEGAGPTDGKLPTENDFIGITERLNENDLNSAYSYNKIGIGTISDRKFHNITQDFRIIYVPAYEKIISYFKCMLAMINECMDYEYYHFPIEDFVKFTKDNPPGNFKHYFDNEYKNLIEENKIEQAKEYLKEI